MDDPDVARAAKSPHRADELGRRHRDVRPVGADEDRVRRTVVAPRARHSGPGRRPRPRPNRERCLDGSVPSGAEDDQVRSDLPAMSTMTEAARPSLRRVATSRPGRRSRAAARLEERLALGPQICSCRSIGRDVGDAGRPRAAVQLGLRRAARSGRSSWAPDRPGQAGRGVEAMVDSVDPSIASSAFIGDSFDGIVARPPGRRARASRTVLAGQSDPCVDASARHLLATTCGPRIQ